MSFTTADLRNVANYIMLLFLLYLYICVCRILLKLILHTHTGASLNFSLLINIDICIFITKFIIFLIRLACNVDSMILRFFADIIISLFKIITGSYIILCVHPKVNSCKTSMILNSSLISMLLLRSSDTF